MQIVASHRERRRSDGSLSIEAILILGEVEYVLERNCQSRRVAQHLAEEELRLIRRLILARLRQLGSEKREARNPFTSANEGVASSRQISPVPSGTKPNGELRPSRPPDKISVADL
jgi:hypothetical protein